MELIMKQSAKFFLFVLVSFFCVDLMAEDKAKELNACITEYIDSGFATKNEILAAKNPVDIAFTKNCRPSTSNNDSINSAYLYYEAWKNEFEFAIQIITYSLKDGSESREFSRFGYYVKDIENFDRYDVLGSHLNNDGELTGGTSADGIRYISWATFYRMNALYLIKQHLNDHKYRISGAILSQELTKRNQERKSMLDKVMNMFFEDSKEEKKEDVKTEKDKKEKVKK